MRNRADDAFITAARVTLDGMRAIDVGQLSPQNGVDLQILANRLELIRFNTGEVREHEWNPMLANPGRAVYLLIARDFAPITERLRSVARRLTAVPAALGAARDVLGSMPKVHIETALTQFAGTANLIGAELDRVLTGLPGSAARQAELAGPRSTALEAINEHRRWLQRRLDEAHHQGSRDPRIGADLFRHKLRLTLDAAADADEIVSRAEMNLEGVTEQIAETAGRLPGTSHGDAGSPRAGAGDRHPGDANGSAELVRQVLDRLAADAPEDNTILALVEKAFHKQCAFETPSPRGPGSCCPR